MHQLHNKSAGSQLPALLSSLDCWFFFRRSGPSRDIQMDPSGAVSRIASAAIVNTCAWHELQICFFFSLLQLQIGVSISTNNMLVQNPHCINWLVFLRKSGRETYTQLKKLEGGTYTYTYSKKNEISIIIIIAEII